MENGAETLVGTLLEAGLRVCFANPGTSEMHFVAALDKAPEMRCVLCLFEGGATGAADGYFRMTGEVAAALLHLAPGFGNGFANLHNARKAGSGVLTLMGDHASYHLRHEAPLKGDTEGISRAVSHWTHVAADAATAAADGAAALRAARAGNGRIATLILPADTMWSPAEGRAPGLAPPAPHRPSRAEAAAAAAALREPGAALLLEGAALWGPLSHVAGRIARATGCRLLAPYFPSRLRRGAGAVKITRMAYRIEPNIELLATCPALVLCGAERPAGFFAYPGLPSLPEAPGTRVLELARRDMDLGWTLEALAEAAGAGGPLGPGDLQPLDLPELPKGRLTLPKLGAALAALLPEEAVVIDEAISSAAPLAAATETARGHDWLGLTGGAIGIGLPLATGAAVACPGRKVVVLQADGSGMYTLQSLWTMARERLDVVVVVLANRGYQVLRLEMAALGAGEAGHNASRMMDVTGPDLDWVALAEGHGVAAMRVTEAEAFNEVFAAAMARPGPCLIEVVCAED